VPTFETVERKFEDRGLKPFFENFGCATSFGNGLVGHSFGLRRGGVCLPRLTAVTYAAATSTLICLGLASSRSGSRIDKTPALYSALALAASTVDGSANVRANDP
jgi:hypothetical protein